MHDNSMCLLLSFLSSPTKVLEEAAQGSDGEQMACGAEELLERAQELHDSGSDLRGFLAMQLAMAKQHITAIAADGGAVPERGEVVETRQD